MRRSHLGLDDVLAITSELFVIFALRSRHFENVKLEFRRHHPQEGRSLQPGIHDVPVSLLVLHGIQSIPLEQQLPELIACPRPFGMHELLHIERLLRSTLRLGVPPEAAPYLQPGAVLIRSQQRLGVASRVVHKNPRELGVKFRRNPHRDHLPLRHLVLLERDLFHGLLEVRRFPSDERPHRPGEVPPPVSTALIRFQLKSAVVEVRLALMM